MPVRFLAGALLLFLASCGAGTTGPVGNTDATTTTSEPVVVVGDVTLTRSGGIAGFVTMVTVSSDGVVTVVEDSQAPRESILPAAQLDTLHSMVASPEFAALLETYVPPEGVCCDFFFYEVTAAVGDSIVVTTTADTVETPLVLQQVIDLLAGLMAWAHPPARFPITGGSIPAAPTARPGLLRRCWRPGPSLCSRIRQCWCPGPPW